MTSSARRASAAAGLVASLLAFGAAACGGGDDAGPAATGAETAQPERSIAARLDAVPGEDVEIGLGTSDFAVGENRIAFIVVRGNGSLVQAPRARLTVARSVEAAPLRSVTATLVPIGPHTHAGSTDPHDHADATDLYVANVRIEQPGEYVLLAEPEGARVQATATIEVAERTTSPPVGTKAIASDNPTVADAPAAEITTAEPPDVELLRWSIADSLRERKPFVVTFATPAFCASRTCGPTVEVVDAVRERYERRGVRFIHVEVYENNDPQQGLNRWMKEWRLPTEPWTFLVDRRGIIRAKFEGAVSVDELAAAVSEHLL